jgi:hypothetical protein
MASKNILWTIRVGVFGMFFTTYLVRVSTIFISVTAQVGRFSAPSLSLA